MRIVEVIPELIHAGAERFVVDLCNQLVKSNEVYLVVLYPINNTLSIVKEIDKRIKVISTNKQKGFDFAVILRLNNLISKIKPNVVHSHLYSITYLFPSFMVRKHIVFIHTIHSHAKREAETGIKRLLRKYAFSHHKVYPITISEESKASFSEFYGLDSKLIYNGRPAVIENKDSIENARHEIETHRISQNSTIFINVARIFGVKNQVALAEAINTLTINGMNIELFIVGDAKDETVKERILSLNNSRIHLMGLKKEPRDYMRFADAFVLSSKMEGMPITLIEAFSVGIVPICTAVGGVKNMINDGVNGILIPSPGIEDIINSLIRFMNLSVEEKHEMALSSSHSYDNYTIEKCAKNYESFMTELIKK